MIKQKTLDMLDADLKREQKKYLNYDHKIRYALFTRKSVRIDPNWSSQKFSDIDKHKLSWSKPYKYSEHPDFKTIIPTNDIGIYIMYVKPDNTILDMPSYVMNVGISGEKGKKRPLKDRLTDYFYINQVKLRTNIHHFLQMYYDYVYIRYAIYTGHHKDLESVEKLLHEFYNPLYNERDFEPKTKKAKKAW